MWDRKELKAKGKAAYNANRVACIIAALILLIASGGGLGASVGSNYGNFTDTFNNNNNSSIDLDVDDLDDIDDIEDAFDLDEDGIDFGNNGASSGIPLLIPLIAGAVLFVVIIAVLIGSALGIFLLNPLIVGLRKFFIQNAGDPKASLSRENVGLAFSDNYMNVVGSMFTTNLFIFLWSLLLIVPGIYKSYQWRMVAYLISENPGMTGSEAREISARMMNGSKWAAFVLDLSFLGWKLLGGFTLGILNIVFTNPYVAATDAELYLTLSGRPSQLQTADSEGSGDYVEFEVE